jgi:hypothetical protein
VFPQGSHPPTHSTYRTARYFASETLSSEWTTTALPSTTLERPRPHCRAACTRHLVTGQGSHWRVCGCAGPYAPTRQQVRSYNIFNNGGRSGHSRGEHEAEMMRVRFTHYFPHLLLSRASPSCSLDRRGKDATGSGATSSV